MPEDMEHPPRGYNTADVRAQDEPKRKRRSRFPVFLLALVAVPVLVFALWTWVALNYVYSTGERAGYLQKFSRKGWVCKSWEGELALANIPGAMPEIFRFSVRDANVANRLSQAIGQRVAVVYAQHRGIPTHCFGDTQYFATDERPAPQ
jgi:hypothetical protein